ncbi:hypothetical protein BJ964_008636 [Actinoplanes lobatus]|uniref:Uncharacterized protein n=1 Tax=Actinoplanes lobatus TaxID=113568 RepID=A0A7W7HPW6_9ACTN|nr:hypothetical protein [Actinoplanes lobatus]
MNGFFRNPIAKCKRMIMPSCFHPEPWNHAATMKE